MYNIYFIFNTIFGESLLLSVTKKRFVVYLKNWHFSTLDIFDIFILNLLYSLYSIEVLLHSLANFSSLCIYQLFILKSTPLLLYIKICSRSLNFQKNVLKQYLFPPNNFHSLPTLNSLKRPLRTSTKIQTLHACFYKTLVSKAHCCSHYNGH